MHVMCSTGRLTVKYLEVCELWYVAYMLAYASVLHLTICRITWSLWHGTRGLTKLGLKICELTCEALHVYIWRGLGTNVGIFVGIDF